MVLRIRLVEGNLYTATVLLGGIPRGTYSIRGETKEQARKEALSWLHTVEAVCIGKKTIQEMMVEQEACV